MSGKIVLLWIKLHFAGLPDSFLEDDFLKAVVVTFLVRQNAI
jgi:hypothetical protein